MKSINDLIGLWPDLDAFAQDAGASRGLVAVWRCRGAIPYARWARLERAAGRRRIRGFSVSDLARWAEERAL